MSGWKTLILNLASLALLLIDYFLTAGQFLGSILTKPEHYAFAMMGLNVANLVLRFFTSGPMAGRK